MAPAGAGLRLRVTLRLPLWRAADGRTVRPAPPAGAALDAVTAVVRHLHRLGHRRIRRAGRPPGPGIALAGPGLVVRLDPADLPVPVRDVECLWLTAMAQGAECVHYSLAGYTAEALARAGALGVPLFALDPPGTRGRSTTTPRRSRTARTHEGAGPRGRGSRRRRTGCYGLTQVTVSTGKSLPVEVAVKPKVTLPSGAMVRLWPAFPTVTVPSEPVASVPFQTWPILVPGPGRQRTAQPSRAAVPWFITSTEPWKPPFQEFVTE